MRLKLVSAGLFLSIALPAFPQAAPSATQGGFPIMIGGGYSYYYSDFSHNIGGPTLWLDAELLRVHGPGFTRGTLGLEAEGRDLNYARSGDDPKLRESTGEGGVTYDFARFGRIQPYTKFLLGFGAINFTNKVSPYYTHDSRTLLAPGGGLQYRLYRNIWVRGDYEYQFWLHFFRDHAMNPEGGTIGVSYDLSRLHSR
jgi:hypothetical protein